MIVLAVIDLAKQAGFSLDEIKILLYGFSDDTPPPTRWRTLARTKLAELDQQMDQLEAMKVLLREGLDCDCLRFDDCAVLIPPHKDERDHIHQPVGPPRFESPIAVDRLSAHSKDGCDVQPELLAHKLRSQQHIDHARFTPRHAPNERTER